MRFHAEIMPLTERNMRSKHIAPEREITEVLQSTVGNRKYKKDVLCF